jgi:hypothetical protein
MIGLLPGQRAEVHSTQVLCVLSHGWRHGIWSQLAAFPGCRDSGLAQAAIKY